MKNSKHEKFMKVCIDLAELATKNGDFPFGSIVVLKDKIIGRGYNKAIAKKEICLHAEIIALIDAQKKLSREQLSQCTIYSTVEPCPMCSFAIKELNIKKLVFGLRSPFMGGYSRWAILQDKRLNKKLPEIFSEKLEIIPDIFKQGVIKGWQKWNKKSWDDFYKRGLFS
jgi:tRNA(adenine34) deaminase